jgi:integrase
MMWSTHSRRIDKISRSAKPFCQGEAGAVGFRHDFGTRLLRDSGNLKLVQNAMNHRDIKSTMRYAHVLDEDVAAAIEDVAKSRKKSRTAVRKVG